MKGLVILTIGLAAVAAQVQAAEFSKADICKASIAVEMGRDVGTMKTLRAGDVPEISYVRDDGDRFRYRCKLVGNKVIWSAYFDDTRSWGRWRDQAQDDSTLTYTAAGRQLTIDSDQAESETFNKADFGN